MSAPVPWTLDHIAADEVARPAMRAAIRALYTEVYAEEPYLRTEADAAAWDEGVLARHLANPYFRLVFARSTEGGVPYGFALGTALQPDTRWWSGMLDPLPDRMTREDGRQTFAVYEFVVRKQFRRQRLGTAMHRRARRPLDRLPHHAHAAPECSRRGGVLGPPGVPRGRVLAPVSALAGLHDDAARPRAGQVPGRLGPRNPVGRMSRRPPAAPHPSSGMTRSP
ncbi:hypothetical protein ACU686_42425 [Yinghuangia aomiensis]